MLNDGTSDTWARLFLYSGASVAVDQSAMLEGVSQLDSAWSGSVTWYINTPHGHILMISPG